MTTQLEQFTEAALRGTGITRIGHFSRRMVGEVRDVSAALWHSRRRAPGAALKAHWSPVESLEALCAQYTPIIRRQASMMPMYHKNMTLAQKAGMRYECQVKNKFQDHRTVYDDLKFTFKNGQVLCNGIPDFLLIDNVNKSIIVGEVKLQHSIDAFIQLDYYTKVVKKWAPGWEVQALEVCGTYHDTVMLPVQKELHSFSAFPKINPAKHNVLILSTRGIKL